MIRVLVVDDSPFVCRLLSGHLSSADDIEVVATANSGSRALAKIADLNPDVITLDQSMPGMNGVETLERIMYEYPTPVVMISGVSRQAAVLTRTALQMGAVDFVLKYTPGADTHPDELRHEIVAKVRAAAQVKVIRSIRRRRDGDPFVPPTPRKVVKPPEIIKPAYKSFVPGGVVVIGASTGGPVALRELLGGISADFPAAIIVVQHMPASFTDVLAEQLNRHTPLPVKEAATGDLLRAGIVYVAPGDQHLLIDSASRIQLNRGPKIRGHRPAIDVTMQSVAQLYGAKAKGVILTGMGDDGTEGMVAIRAKGGRTFAQDEETSVVNGMPQRARDRGAVDVVANPFDLAEHLMRSFIIYSR